MVPVDVWAETVTVAGNSAATATSAPPSQRTSVRVNIALLPRGKDYRKRLAARCTTGPSDYQRGRKRFPAGFPVVGRPQRLEQPGSGPGAQGMDVHVHRGERRVDITGHRDVVEPADGDVAGKAKARIAEGADGPDRHAVVGGKA